MLADDVDDAGIRLLGVVQIGKAVGKTGAEMQQRRGRRALHAEIAVGGAGHHAFEQAEHATHAGHAVERCDKMHLGGAGVGEADVDPALDHRPHQTFRTVHPSAPATGNVPTIHPINHCSLVSSKQ
ncbi:hypothetical protein ACVWZK_002716 [Bradyrhizobium sp. GM0.4]